jgi:hypothetical protein
MGAALLCLSILLLAFLALGILFVRFTLIFKSPEGLSNGSSGDPRLFFRSVVKSWRRFLFKGDIGIIL